MAVNVDHLRHDIATTLCRSADPPLSWNQALGLADLLVELNLLPCPGGHPVEGGLELWWCEDCKTATPTVTAIHRIHHADSLVERFLIPLPQGDG